MPVAIVVVKPVIGVVRLVIIVVLVSIRCIVILAPSLEEWLFMELLVGRRTVLLCCFSCFVFGFGLFCSISFFAILLSSTICLFSFFLSFNVLRGVNVAREIPGDEVANLVLLLLLVSLFHVQKTSLLLPWHITPLLEGVLLAQFLNRGVFDSRPVLLIITVILL